MPETTTLLSLAFGYLVTLGLVRWVVLTRKRQPASTIAWILAIVLLPYLGGVLFLFFGINRVARRKLDKQAAARVVAAGVKSKTSQAVDLEAVDSLTPLQARLTRLVTELAGDPLTTGNAIEILADTQVTQNRIEQAIDTARESIHLEYYIWQPDRTGTRVRDQLVAKARQGVKVRFLYDQFGSMLLSRRFLRPLRDAGVQVAPFLPGASLRERWSINLRSHRKIVVVDGRTAFTGGMNIGNEYLGRKPDRDLWRDTHLRFQGPLTQQLQQVFAEDWFYATNEELPVTAYPEPAERGTTLAHVVADGPDGERQAFYHLFFNAINEARSRITLATSYFVPPEALVAALENAARRGVEVRLLLQGRTANTPVLWAARSYYESLLAAGVRIHEFTRGVLHCKTLAVDSEWCLVGTANFDSRSVFLNFEVAVAMPDVEQARILEAQYERDLESAREITRAEWPHDPHRRPFLENACRLLSPVM